MENNSDKKNRKIKDIYKDVYKCNKYSVQTFFFIFNQDKQLSII